MYVTRSRRVHKIVKLPLLCLFLFLYISLLPIFLISQVSAQDEDLLHADTFFCTTRYGRNIDEYEDDRIKACQSGYDGESCDEESEKNEMKDACEAGRDAEKPLPEEVSVSALGPEPTPSVSFDTGSNQDKCGITNTAYVVCPPVQGISSGSAVFSLLSVIFNIAIAVVGVISLGAIVYAGVLWASASDNSGQVSRAIGIIRNTLIGLVVFALFYLLIQYIIPGGVF